MNIKITKAVFESAQMSRARNDVRPYLNAIAILPDLRVAGTNGHVLFVGEKAYCSNPIKSPVLIDVQKSPTQRYHHVVINTKTGLATFRTDKNENMAVSLVKVVDGKYPDVDKFLSQFKSQSTSEIGFYSGYLSMIGKVSKLFNPKWRSVKVLLSGNAGMTISEFSSIDDDSKGKLVVMPMRID